MDDEELMEALKRVPDDAALQRVVNKLNNLPSEERQKAWKEYIADRRRPATQQDVYDFVRRLALREDQS